MSETMHFVRQQWEQLYESDKLTVEVITDHFKLNGAQYLHVVPLSGTSLENCFFNEEAAKIATIKLIEMFICGTNPEEYLQQIKQTDNASSVCGRVFKIGEPTYSCRECSMDQTCVLCSTCFKKSVHRTHKYKMATSSGGGCCDCGDPEAWKKDPYCEEHDPQHATDEAQPQPAKIPLPDDVKSRCNIMFHSVLHYCMQVLQVSGFGGELSMLDDDENTHCTILYNDETHTFEQVIQTLIAVVKCHQKTAIEYVTSIDREGRAVVMCAPFDVCKKLKEDIENKTLRSTMANRGVPLKVTVMHRSEVGCQMLAIQLLGWFQEFLTKHSAFRSVFADTIMETGTSYNLRYILSNDHNLWKSARGCWQRLLISGMLMEYENKKILAQTFTKQYASLMQDFIRDDHYHAFSIVSLSVQLFTVPTIAHFLIHQESAFFKLMHTYFTETIEKYVKNRQLVFTKNTSTMNGFKRAAYILIDLKYLLSFKPDADAWTHELRTGFLHGMQLMIRLLKYMQGMDAVTRQVGQHMEYEQEWETAFTLHLKLSHLITLVLDWCASDRIVLIKVYRMVLLALSEVRFIVHESEPQLREVADHSACCLMYDVTSKPVSVHLPLTRFLAGLYIAIQKYGLGFDTIIPSSIDRPAPERIIEPVLCARTMMSQVHAGMWRRNGYALINQLFFYRNVKCRYEMLDRDIVILQIGASLIEANEFIIHLLNKYKLLGWLESDQLEKPARPVEAGGNEDDYIRHTAVLVEELLELLIVIIGERFVRGVGDVTENDRIKKEIVQQLCIKPHSHSELNRALNEDNCSEIVIESVIQDVAVFEKPNASDKKGVYKLKEEFYSWYNLYFYHYSKEDKSKSEEAQRNRQKEKNELVCCPPPVLPKLAPAFNIIPNLLQCDVMLEIMRAILTRALDLKSITFTEGQLQRMLHLIGYALHEEDSGHYPYLQFLARTQLLDLLSQLEELSKSKRVESQRDLLRWVIQRYKAMVAKKQAMETGECSHAEASGSGSSTTDSEDVEKEQRAKIAAMRRAQVLAQMQNAQKVFMNMNPDYMNATNQEDDGPSDAPKPDDDNSMDWQSQPVCLGQNRQLARPGDGGSLRYTCILCSEESTLDSETDACLVYAAFVQRSSVLSRYQQTDEHGELQLIETKTHPAPHVSTCGHVMHDTCFEKYFSNEMVKEHRRPYRSRVPILFDIEKREFLCPLCRSLSNALLPLLPPLESIIGSALTKHYSGHYIPPPVWETGYQQKQLVDNTRPESIPDRFMFEFWYSFMSDFIIVAKEEKKQFDENPPATFPRTPCNQHATLAFLASRPATAAFKVTGPFAFLSNGPVLETVAASTEAAMARVGTFATLQEYVRAGQIAAANNIAANNAAANNAATNEPVATTSTAGNDDNMMVDDLADASTRDANDDDEDDGIDGDETDEEYEYHLMGELVKYHPDYILMSRIMQKLEKAYNLPLRISMSREIFGSIRRVPLQKFCNVVSNFTTLPVAVKRFGDHLACWLSCSYTIRSMEMLLRVMERPFGSELSIRYSSCLRGLVRVSSILGTIIPSRVHHSHMMRYLVDLYETLFGYKASPSFFEWDLFGILCTCLFSTRSVIFSWTRTERIPKGDSLDHSIVQAIFLVNVLRTVITSSAGVAPAEDDSLVPSGPLDDSSKNLLLMYRAYNIHLLPGDLDAGSFGDLSTPEAQQAALAPAMKVEDDASNRRLCAALVRDIRSQSQALLRCCCLLFNAITDVELPKCSETEAVDHDFNLMMGYLGLPVDIIGYFQSGEAPLAFIERLAHSNSDEIERMRWARHEQLLGSRTLFQAAPAVRRLIDLPDDYSDLINGVSQFTCPNNIRDDSRNPTMCLVCGEILCSQSFCCQRELDKSMVGSCTYHTAECGAGIGIFLRIRDAEILLLGINKGCFIPAPYLDAYGETDQGLRRGNPLRLCTERYRKLHQIWLSHGLHEEITRRNETQQTLFATQWQNL